MNSIERDRSSRYFWRVSVFFNESPVSMISSIWYRYRPILMERLSPNSLRLRSYLSVIFFFLDRIRPFVIMDSAKKDEVLDSNTPTNIMMKKIRAEYGTPRVHQRHHGFATNTCDRKFRLLDSKSTVYGDQASSSIPKTGSCKALKEGRSEKNNHRQYEERRACKIIREKRAKRWQWFTTHTSNCKGCRSWKGSNKNYSFVNLYLLGVKINFIHAHKTRFWSL